MQRQINWFSLRRRNCEHSIKNRSSANIGPRLVALLVLSVCLVSSTSCRRAPSNSAAIQPQAVRIVSLSPAISRTLVDVNVQDKVVGRTPYCAALNPSIPTVGDLVNIDYEQLVRLKPTHVLVQPPQAGVDQHLIELAQQHGWKIQQWALNNIDDIETLVRELPAALFADGTPEFAACGERSAEVLNQIAAALTPGAQPIFRGRILMVYSLSPISVFGTETYLDDVLRAMGGSNAVTDRGWIGLSLEDVVRVNPDAMIAVRPEMQYVDYRAALGPLWDVEVQATVNRSLAVMNHPEAFLPSTSIIEVAKQLREILERFEANRPQLQ